MKRIALCLLVFFLAAPASAETAFQFTAPGLRAPDDPEVGGFRFSLLHGANDKMSGLDFGLLSFSDSKSRSGAAFIFGVSQTSVRSSGFNGGLIVIHKGEASGVNAGFINSVETMKNGANIGFINITQGYSAVDISGMGISDRSDVQVGFINITKRIEGFQIGFLNIAENGFLPVFPFFNFAKSEKK